MTPQGRSRSSVRKRGARAARSSAPGRSPPRRAQKLLWARLLVVLVLLLCVLWGALFVWGMLPASPAERAHQSIRIESRDRRAAAEALARAGVLDAPKLMLAYLTLVQPWAEVVPRQHWLGGGHTPRELGKALADRPQEVVRVALPEGRTSFELAERLERAGVCSGQAFLEATRNPTLLTEFGIARASAEGYLFPESYELYVDDRPERVASKFLREGQRRQRQLEQELPLEAEHRALGFAWSDIVTLASIVERETGRPEERPRIARVFLNRLRAPRGETGGRLESDPTALYGCQALGPLGPPSCQRAGAPPELNRDELNPYGTYRRSGLPPGPIGNPGEDALRAVLRPAAGDELYFVADGQGNHHFSRTFAEHRLAVERLKALRHRPNE